MGLAVFLEERGTQECIQHGAVYAKPFGDIQQEQPSLFLESIGASS